MGGWGGGGFESVPFEVFYPLTLFCFLCSLAGHTLAHETNNEVADNATQYHET